MAYDNQEKKCTQQFSEGYLFGFRNSQRVIAYI